MSGRPPSIPGASAPLASPAAGTSWACLDVPGIPGRRIEARGPFRPATLPPADSLAFYVNDFSLSDPAPWRIPSQTGSAGPQSGPAELRVAESGWTAPDRKQFQAVFTDCMRAIDHRELLKIVPVSSVSAGAASDPAPSLHALLHPARLAGLGHAAAWSDGSRGFAAITPEVLFELSGTRLTTMALAGTADAAHEADLAKGPKLAREHEIVVDELHRRLARLGKVTLTEREIVPLGNVRHLRTSLSVDLPSPPEGPALNELIRLLHPTPALGISPRTPETMALLTEIRSRCAVPAAFGAPFGIAWPGGALFLVAIRGVFWQNLSLQLPAGGGLVAGSDMDTEWAELALKRNWIRQAFNLEPSHA